MFVASSAVGPEAADSVDPGGVQRQRQWLADYSSLGFVTRQEIVSMLPVAFLDVQVQAFAPPRH